MEDEIMGNERKYHRSDANTYSIDCRTGEDSGGLMVAVAAMVWREGEAIRQKGVL
jgi:hypothetical protein